MSTLADKQKIQKQSKMSNEEIDQHLHYLVGSETKYTIIYLLQLYDLLNLKSLARIIGKSQSTIHKHLEDLMERGYINIANTMKGKFYQVSEIIKTIQEVQNQNLEDTDISIELEEIKHMEFMDFIESRLNKFEDEDTNLRPEVVLNLRNLLESSINTNKIIEQASIVSMSENIFHVYLTFLVRLIKRKNLTKLEEQTRKFENSEEYSDKLNEYLTKNDVEINQLTLEHYEELFTSYFPQKRYQSILKTYLKGDVDEDEIKKTFTFGSLEVNNHHIKITNLNQLGRYIELLFNFFKDLKKLENDLDKENENVKEEFITTQILNIFSGSLSRNVNL